MNMLIVRVATGVTLVGAGAAAGYLWRDLLNKDTGGGEQTPIESGKESASQGSIPKDILPEELAKTDEIIKKELPVEKEGLLSFLSRHRGRCIAGVCIAGVVVASAYFFMRWWRLKKQLEEEREQYAQLDNDSRRTILEKDEAISEKIREIELYVQLHNDSRRTILEKDEALSEKIREIELKEREFENVSRKYSDLVREVGKQMSVAIAKDETKVENISAKCRPSILRECYASLSFQTASGLKKDIEKPPNYPEEHWHIFVTRFFCSIFQTAGLEMANLHRVTLRKLNAWMRQPAQEQWSDADNIAQLPSLPEDIRVSFAKFTRENDEDVDMERAVKVIVDKALESVIEQLFAEELVDRSDDRLVNAGTYLKAVASQENESPISKRMYCFVRSLCLLAWKMAIQQPPMEFISLGIGEQIKDNLQKVIPSGKIDFSRLEYMVVDYYLEPALKHGDAILEKGRVVLRDPDQPRIMMRLIVSDNEVEVKDGEDSVVPRGDPEEPEADQEGQQGSVNILTADTAVRIPGQTETYREADEMMEEVIEIKNDNGKTEQVEPSQADTSESTKTVNPISEVEETNTYSMVGITDQVTTDSDNLMIKTDSTEKPLVVGETEEVMGSGEPMAGKKEEIDSPVLQNCGMAKTKTEEYESSAAVEIPAQERAIRENLSVKEQQPELSPAPDTCGEESRASDNLTDDNIEVSPIANVGGNYIDDTSASIQMQTNHEMISNTETIHAENMSSEANEDPTFQKVAEVDNYTLLDSSLSPTITLTGKDTNLSQASVTVECKEQAILGNTTDQLVQDDNAGTSTTEITSSPVPDHFQSSQGEEQSDDDNSSLSDCKDKEGNGASQKSPSDDSSEDTNFDEADDSKHGSTQSNGDSDYEDAPIS